MNDSSGVLIVIVVILIVLAFLCRILIRKSAEESKRLEEQYLSILQRLPSDKQMFFSMQFQNVKKNASTGILLALFLGGLGTHWFYLGKTGRGIIYLLFCWTGIPSIIAIVDAFNMSNTIKNYNLEKATQIATMLSGGPGGFIPITGL